MQLNFVKLSTLCLIHSLFVKKPGWLKVFSTFQKTSKTIFKRSTRLVSIFLKSVVNPNSIAPLLKVVVFTILSFFKNRFLTNLLLFLNCQILLVWPSHILCASAVEIWMLAWLRNDDSSHIFAFSWQYDHHGIVNKNLL